jgi:hypothetical protein
MPSFNKLTVPGAAPKHAFCDLQRGADDNSVRASKPVTEFGGRTPGGAMTRNEHPVFRVKHSAIAPAQPINVNALEIFLSAFS